MLTIKEDSYRIFTNITIKNATIYEQNIFNETIKELFTPMDNPKYLIIKKNVFGFNDYTYSFACPSIFAKNSQNITILKNI